MVLTFVLLVVHVCFFVFLFIISRCVSIRCLIVIVLILLPLLHVFLLLRTVVSYSASNMCSFLLELLHLTWGKHFGNDLWASWFLS